MQSHKADHTIICLSISDTDLLTIMIARHIAEEQIFFILI